MELDVDLGQRSPARAEPFADAFAPAEPETVLKAGKPWLMHPSPEATFCESGSLSASRGDL